MTIDGNGILEVKVQPPAPGRYDRIPGLYRGLVYAEDPCAPRVLAEIVLEIRSQAHQ